MTPLEHRNLELASQTLAYRTAMQWATRSLASTLRPLPPAVRTAALAEIQKKVEFAGKDYQEMSFPEKSAAESDLWAGLVQEAFDTVFSEFMAILRNDGK